MPSDSNARANSGKYEPLHTFLVSQRTQEVPVAFSDIERLIDDRLPASAYRYRAWWSNNPSNSVITHAWLAAGYKTERVDMARQRLVFRRARPRDPELTGADARPPTNGEAVLKNIEALLGGTVQFRADIDLTAPTGEAWDAEAQ